MDLELRYCEYSLDGVYSFHPGEVSIETHFAAGVLGLFPSALTVASRPAFALVVKASLPRIVCISRR